MPEHLVADGIRPRECILCMVHSTLKYVHSTENGELCYPVATGLKVRQ